ncbi:MAG: hypothetical protein SVZ03_16885 [Spirochaetota bacterium]|nr:hypothetical protein [Spirochaetota bacterium]
MKLSGVEKTTKFPSLSIGRFFTGQFQRDIEKWLSYNIGLRAAFIRIDNQINYSFFNYVSATPSIIIGKDKWLYSTPYIDNYYNRDIVPICELEKKAINITKLQKLLKSKDIGFLLIITPNKASIYPEYIPEYIKKKYIAEKNVRKKSNYENIISLFNKYKINYLDGHSFFIELKKKSPYPLFPKSGIHWSYYSAYFFTDKFISTLERIINKKLTSINFKDIEITKIPFGSDNDIAELTNIIFTKSLYDRYQYPKISCRNNNGKLFKPKLLFVGGSFLRNIFYYLNTCDVYSQCNLYFYYNLNRTLPQQTDEVIDKKNLNLYMEMLKNNIIIIEANEQVINNIGFGFVEDALKAFNKK